jgi:hypothetical protein
MKNLIVVLLLAVTPLLVHGHHSNAEYDFNVVQELQGEILEVSWRNPHVELVLRTNGGEASEAIWDLEAQDVNSLRRRGLDGSLIGVGDIVRVAGNASTIRPNNLSVTNLLLPSGTEISIRGNTQPRWSAENIGFQRTSPEQVLADAGRGEGLFRVWMSAGPGGFPASLPLTASAQDARANWNSADDPTMQCIPSGMPAAMRLSPPHPIDLREVGDDIVLRVELFDIERTIHMNAEAVVGDQVPSALGYSVGHWEGATLVVRTANINWPYFDHVGSIPQGTSVETTERLSVSDDSNRMVYELTVNDRSTFSQPVTGRWNMAWRPDMVVEPFECVAPA